MKKAIVGGLIVTETGVLKNYVLLYGETIDAIVPENEWDNKENYTVINLNGEFVSPGFIDVHIHGVSGCDTMDGTIESLQTISNKILETGVTSILATTMTQSRDDIYKALLNVRNFRESQENGATVLGVHMEGPFISKEYKGAHDESFIEAPSIDFIKDYLDVIMLITMAPEVQGADEFINQMKNYPDVTLSIGHSGATFNKVTEAYENGVSHMTHCFNAMSPLHHREPGVVGAALTKDFSCELICDNIHVATSLYQGFIDIKGIEKTVLITDSMRAGCLKAGKYNLGGQEVFVEDGAVRLEDGTLAGSVLTMNKALLNIIKETNLEIYKAIYMATMSPAKAIGIDKQKGSIKIGKDADICIHDENMNIIKTIVKGKLQFRSEVI